MLKAQWFLAEWLALLGRVGFAPTSGGTLAKKNAVVVNITGFIPSEFLGGARFKWKQEAL